jgi:hypothetical protein
MFVNSVSQSKHQKSSRHVMAIVIVAIMSIVLSRIIYTRPVQSDSYSIGASAPRRVLTNLTHTPLSAWKTPGPNGALASEDFSAKESPIFLFIGTENPPRMGRRPPKRSTGSAAQPQGKRASRSRNPLRAGARVSHPKLRHLPDGKPLSPNGWGILEPRLDKTAKFHAAIDVP